jgi:hypothetical protein
LFDMVGEWENGWGTGMMNHGLCLF